MVDILRTTYNPSTNRRTVARYDSNQKKYVLPDSQSAYQSNLQQQPAKAPETTRSILSKIQNRSAFDPQGANDLMASFTQLQQNPTSKYYNPYTLPTNQAVRNLQSFGIDTSNPNWMSNYSWLRNDYILGGTTNTPQKPGKKSTVQQQAAYEYYQYGQAEDLTQKAEQERKALDEFMSYWATQTDRNYSDQQILDKIDWSKYPTLSKMRDSMKSDYTGGLLELNRAVDASDDYNYGVLWAARNNGGTGNALANMANSASGKGNVWKENKAISDRLNPDNRDTVFNPYAIGCTMDEERVYFGVSAFDQKWLDDNYSGVMSSNDATKKNAYARVYDAEQFTQKAETQAADLRKSVQGWIDNEELSEEDILKNLDRALASSTYSALNSMDQSIESGKLLDITRKVDYRKNDMIQFISDGVAARKQKKTPAILADEFRNRPAVGEAAGLGKNGRFDLLGGALNKDVFTGGITGSGVKSGTVGVGGSKGMTQPPALNGTELAKEAMGASLLGSVAPTITEKGTDAEKVALRSGKTTRFDYFTEMNKMADRTAQTFQERVEKTVPNNYLEQTRTTYDFQKHQQNLDKIGEQLENIRPEWETLQTRQTEMDSLGGITREQYSNLGRLMTQEDGLDWDWANDTLQYEPDSPEAEDILRYIYNQVTDEDPLTSPEPESCLAQARVWWNFMNKGRGSLQLEALEQEAEQGYNEYGDEIREGQIQLNNGQMATVELKRDREGTWVVRSAVNDETGDEYTYEQLQQMTGRFGLDGLDPLSNDEKARLDMLTQTKNELETAQKQEQDYLSANEEVYNESKQLKQYYQELYAKTGMLSNATGGKVDLSTLPTLEYAYAVAQDYKKHGFTSTNVFDAAVEQGKMDRAQAAQNAGMNSIACTQEAIQLQGILDRIDGMGIELSEQERNNIQSQIDDLKADAYDSACYLLDDLPGFAETAKATMEKAANGQYSSLSKAIATGNMSLIDRALNLQKSAITEDSIRAMTDAEKNRYFYLLGTEGEEAAGKYWNSLIEEGRGVLNVRRDQQMQEEIRNFASQNIWTSTVATGLSFITNMMGGPQAAIYEIGQRITGNDVDPYSAAFMWQNATGAARAGVEDRIKRTYGEDTTGGKLVSLFYQGFTSFIDSRLNAAMTTAAFDAVGSLFSKFQGVQTLTAVKQAAESVGGGWAFAIKAGGDLAHAIPMGINSAASAYREAIMNGGTEDQALGMAIATFFSGIGTEAITFGNFRDAFLNGSDEAKRGITEFVSGLLKNGAEEFLGEASDELAGQIAERAIMQGLSGYEKRVKELQAQGIPETVARSLADQEAWKDVLKAGMVGFISSALGYPGEYARGAYESQTTENNVIPPDLAAQDTKAAAKVEVQEATIIDSANQQAKDAELLLAASDGNPTAAAINIASVLNTGDNHADKAAAQTIVDLFGGNGKRSAQFVEELLNRGMRKLDIVKASLSKGDGHTALNSVAKQFYGTPITVEEINGIRAALNRDMTNDTPGFDEAIQSAIKENRIATRTIEILAADGQKQIETAQAAVDQAQTTLAHAQDGYEQAEANAKAVSDNLLAVESEYDPAIPETAAPLEQATNQLEGAIKVKEEYQQSVQNAQENVQEAQDNLAKTQDEALMKARTQATQEIEQEIAQEAEAAAEAAEQARIAQEEAAKAQAEEDEKTGKAWEDKRDALIEDLLNRDQLEGEERDAKREEYLKRAEQIKLGKIDMSGLMNNTEGLLAVSSFGRKLGLNFSLSDDLGNARGMYKDGTVYLNSDLIKKGKMTIGQALVEASLHEITHSMENTKSYDRYSKIVMESLFRGDEAKMNAAIEQKMADYKRLKGQDLSETQAKQEIVADFARTHLNEKEVVQRFIDSGLGGTIRNTLHNINQAIKNFRLKGEERVTAEYLRRAERQFQKGLDEVAKMEVHPEGGQFSVMQFAQSAGMRFDDQTLTLYDDAGNEIDGVNNRVTTEMIDRTPVGMLIDSGLTGDQNASAKQMMADLMNMVARYKDSDLIWEIGASTLSSTFSALKANSDPQYQTTVDFGTVCAKTQAIVDVMSQVMLDKIDPETGMLKEGAKRGLTQDEIMKIYDVTHEAGLSVPCPVCYVFSRWMGVPSLLGQMSQFQHDYVATKEDGSIDVQATQQRANDYIRKAEEKYGDSKNINDVKTRLQNKLTSLEERRENATNDENKKEIASKMADVKSQLKDVEAYNWITQALCKQKTVGRNTIDVLDENGNHVIDPKFQITPDAILFDLNRTGEFAGYEKNWKYRNTRGAGMGKAIMPYSGEAIGDILYDTNSQNKKWRQSSLKNPWLNMDSKSASRQLRYAKERARKQNLVGGQRLQSTSDFRPEWGLDYIMSFLELQAAGSKVQMYTKVPEAVDFFASVGADVNLSIMGNGQGWHVDKDGNKVLDFSSITGMNYETAKALKDKYDNVQMILVGMNDTHIRLAMANSDIDFIIPWHSSGNSKDVLAGLIGSVGEKLDSSVDYSTTQTDKVSENQTKEQKALWDARVKLLTEGGDALNQSEREALLSNPYTKDLYYRFTKKGVDPDCYGVKLNKSQAEQIFPYEYWQVTEKDENGNNVPARKENADVNGHRFVEYCESMGIVPRFSQFKDDPGYWKLLIDRQMYNNDGTYHQQQIIDVTNARIGALNESGHLVDSDIPTQAQAKYAPNDPRNENYAKYTEAEQRAIEAAKAAINKQYDDGTEGQYSVYGDTTMADMEQLFQTENDYMDAISRGDLDGAQEDVETYAASKGYTDKAYHGTRDFGFTVFDMDRSQNEIFVAFDKEVAQTYTRGGDVKNISEGGLSIDFNSLSGDELTDLFRNTFPTNEVTDVRMLSVDEIRNRYNEAKENMLKILEGATFTTDALREDTISFMATRCNVDKSVFDDVNTPTELQEKIIELSINSKKPTYNVKLMLTPVLTAFGKDANGGYLGTNDANKIAESLIDANKLARTNQSGVEYTSTTGHKYELTRKQAIDGIKNRTQSGEGVYQLLTRPGDQLVIDADGARWNKIYAEAVLDATDYDASAIFAFPEGSDVTTRQIAEWARENGYDSVRINNVSDNGGMSVYGDLSGFGDIGIFFNQEDVKSADTVTQDDQGNVIPLNERFTDSADIRYSAGGDITTADMEQLLSDEQVALSSDFAKQIDQWDGESDKAQFIIGKPSERLKSVGIPDNDITMSGEAVKHSMNGHPEITIDIIKQIPTIVNRPILVMKSKTVPGRITMFGELIAEDGSPVLAVMNAKPTYNRELRADTISIVNAYGKNRNPQNFINTSEILYVDKERAGDWASGLRLQLPSSASITGSYENSVPQENGDVNGQFSSGGDMTIVDIDQDLIDSGIVTPDEVAAVDNLPGSPAPTEGGSAQRQFGRQTAQESDALHQEVKDYLYNNSSYTPDSNQAQIDRSIDWVQSHATEQDPDGYFGSLQEIESPNFDYRSADGQARMLTVMSKAALKGDVAAETRVADAFNKQGTDLGRQLQARKLFRLMTPLGRRATLQSMTDQINDEYARKGNNTRVGLSEWTLKAAESANTEEDFNKVRQHAEQELAEQMPANWKDRLRGWRMLSMLGNPRTHIRNIIGNAMFIPAVSLKNKVGALAEIATRQDERTKTLAPAVSKEIRDFARADAVAMKDTLTGEAKYNDADKVKREQKTFGGFLQAISDFNSNALEAEDWFFLKGHYRRALGGWMQANGYTVEQVQNDPALLEKGRAYAIEEAQKATYRDFSKIASTLNKVSRDGGVAGFLVDAALPFKKTPANILKRGMEYSPAGIVKALTVDAYHLKQYMDYQNGKLKALPEKAISPNQFIDKLCAGLSGTAILAVGALLGNAGIVTCGLDDDDDKFEKEKGNQEYAVKFSLFGQDVTFTMDWAAPMSMPFFVGAAISEALNQGGELDIESLLQAFGNITEPVFNLSMLDGVNTLFKTSQYDDTNTITQIAAKIASNYATSYVPSVLGAVARTVDDTRRKSFVESGKGTGVLGTFRYAREQVENKIPGLSQTNIPVRDVWGNAETSPLAERILENFILPGYVSNYKEDPVLNEMQRLYDATGENSLIPSDPDKTITYNKEKHVLTAEQWDTYKTERGQAAYQLLTELMKDKNYQSADDNAKAEMVKDAWSYANDIGKHAVFPDYDMTSNNISRYKKEMVKALDAEDYEAYNAMVEALHEAGVEDSTIKTKIGDTYRDQYKAAYLSGDYITMMEIENTLSMTGFSFDLNKWEKDADKKKQ